VASGAVAFTSFPRQALPAPTVPGGFPLCRAVASPMTGPCHDIPTFPPCTVPVPMNAVTRNAVTRSAAAADRWAPIAVFAALPTVGLAAGPAYAGLVMGLSVIRMVAALPQRPAIDRPVCVTAAAFVALGWVSIAWSIAPHRTEAEALALTGIAVLLLPLTPGRMLPAGTVERLFRVMAWATMLGAAAATLDMLWGAPGEALVAGRPGVASMTKYNRGIDHLVLVAIPLLAFIWHRRRRLLPPLAVMLVAVLAVGRSSTGQLAAIVFIAVLAVALILPRLVAIVLTGGTVLLAVALPVALHAVAAHRAALQGLIKQSGMNRLEIWDYMTARVLERPLHGWGLAASPAVPITPDELATYHYVTPVGFYPHDQWLQLWVETGAIGAALGLVFALLILRRAERLPVRLRPWGLATFAAAMTIACMNFEITTDSWWAALAAAGFLFSILSRHLEHADDRLPARGR
jgi:exopolysaccharide production protein ExoQ